MIRDRKVYDLRILGSHETNARSSSGKCRDLACSNSYDDTLVGDDHKILRIVYQSTAYERSCLIGYLICDETLTASCLSPVLVDMASLTHTLLGYNEELAVICYRYHSDNFIVITELDTAYTS